MLELNVKHNLPDFKAQLKRFGLDFERRTVRSATLAAANVFKKMVIAEAPSRSGTLKRSIYVTRSKRSSKGAERYVVGFRRGKQHQKRGRDAFYGRFLEMGWVPRAPGQALRGGDRSKALQRARNIAGGAKQYKFPFLSPGFNRGKSAALHAFTTRIAKRIAAESKKL